jgi:hypothetical protein
LANKGYSCKKKRIEQALDIAGQQQLPYKAFLYLKAHAYCLPRFKLRIYFSGWVSIILGAANVF